MSDHLHNISREDLIRRCKWLGNDLGNPRRYCETLSKERLIQEIKRLERINDLKEIHSFPSRLSENASLRDVEVQESLRSLVHNLRPIVFKFNRNFYEPVLQTVENMAFFADFSPNINYLDDNNIVFSGKEGVEDFIDDAFDLVTLRNNTISISFVHIIYDSANDDLSLETLYVVGEIANYGLNRLEEQINEAINQRGRRVIDNLGVVRLERVKAHVDNPKELLPFNVESEFSGTISLIITLTFSVTK